MDDPEAVLILETWPEYLSVFGKVEELGRWLDEAGSFYQGGCVRRSNDGEWLVGQNYSAKRSRRDAIRLEGLIIIEQEIWVHEVEVRNQRLRRARELKGAE
jgi:hypothetical protein